MKKSRPRINPQVLRKLENRFEDVRDIRAGAVTTEEQLVTVLSEFKNLQERVDDLEAELETQGAEEEKPDYAIPDSGARTQPTR